MKKWRYFMMIILGVIMTSCQLVQPVEKPAQDTQVMNDFLTPIGFEIDYTDYPGLSDIFVTKCYFDEEIDNELISVNQFTNEDGNLNISLNYYTVPKGMVQTRILFANALGEEVENTDSTIWSMISPGVGLTLTMNYKTTIESITKEVNVKVKFILVDQLESYSLTFFNNENEVLSQLNLDLSTTEPIRMVIPVDTAYIISVEKSLTENFSNEQYEKVTRILRNSEEQTIIIHGLDAFGVQSIYHIQLTKGN